jgi:hypothetical protein
MLFSRELSVLHQLWDLPDLQVLCRGVFLKAAQPYRFLAIQLLVLLAHDSFCLAVKKIY